MVDFVFNKNDHTAAELLLWPNGFQQYTPTPDDKLFEAYAGDDDRSAIADGHYDADGEWEITGHRFDPDIGAELYITNGDLTDDAYANGILAYTPEGSEPDIPNVSGFEFQDVEADIQAEFLRHKEFVLDLARSADDPANPISHLGNTVENFYVETLRGLLRRPAGRAGRGQEVARRRQAALPDQRRRGQDGRDDATSPAASASTRSPASTTTACAAR